MIKRFLNCFLVLMVILSCFCFKAGAQEIQVIAKLDQTTLRIGDQTKLHLTVDQPAKERVNFPKLADSLTGKVLILSSGKTDTIADKHDRNRITVTKSLMITSFDAGSYTIPPVAFTVSGRTDTLKTNELVLEVTSVKVDTTKAIYDIKQPLTVSYSFIDWLRDNWVLVVLSLLAVLLIGGLIYYFRKRPAKKPAAEAPKPGLPVHTIALNKLKELRDKKLWQQDEVKQYYIELSDVIREYLEKRYLIKTQEKTTDEIFAGLNRIEMTPENKHMLRQLLTLADLAKFAKEKPLPAENEQCMENAVGFVLKTQQAEQSNIEGGTAGEHA